MLSLYAILILTVTSSVFGKRNESCQRDDDSICEIPDMPSLKLNKSCKGFKRNCKEGLTCKKDCAKGEKCKDRVCVKPLAEGEKCKLPNGGRSRNCGKGLKCNKKG